MDRNPYAIVSDPDVALGLECALPPAFSLARADAARPAANAGHSIGTRLRRGIVVIAAAGLLAAGGVEFGRGAWLQAKAWLAQVLIAGAWERTIAGAEQARPWPWADTWPVARMTVPALGVERYVLAGADGRAIAFGPGHAWGTALPGAEGNSLIGGHRDTHLAFLRKLKRGDEIRIERTDGATLHYRVVRMDVLDKRDTWVATQDGPARLTLVTCWPFDALRAGGAQRYAVTAVAMPKS